MILAMSSSLHLPPFSMVYTTLHIKNHRALFAEFYFDVSGKVHLRLEFKLGHLVKTKFYLSLIENCKFVDHSN